MDKKTDLRVLRTKQSIRKAFFELIQEKGYEAITIQDIADQYDQSEYVLSSLPK